MHHFLSPRSLPFIFLLGSFSVACTPDNVDKEKEITDSIATVKNNFTDSIATHTDSVDQDTVFSFQDFFDNDSFDNYRWHRKGFSSDVKIENGILKVEQNVTDQETKAELINLPFKNEFTIERKVYVHNANENSFPSLFINFRQDKIEGEEIRFTYERHSYLGHFGTFVNYNTSYINNQKQIAYHDNYTRISNVLWDKWFDEKIVYNRHNEQLDYYRNGTLLKSVHIALKEAHNKLSIAVSGVGWWTGHYHYTDDFLYVTK